MTEELVLFTNPTSRGRVVRWMLEEVGRPYRAELLDYGPAMRTPGFLGLNPMGKVPVLCHGRTVVTETAAICAYLADAFPDAGLAPPLSDRGAYYRWLFFAAGPIEAAVTAQSMGWAATTERDEGFIGFGSIERVMDALEEALAGVTFIAGDRFSAADLYLASRLDAGIALNCLEPRPAIEAYLAKATDRDARRRARALDDAFVPVPPPS